MNMNMLRLENLIFICARKRIRIWLRYIKIIFDVNEYECNMDSYKYEYDKLIILTF